MGKTDITDAVHMHKKYHEFAPLQPTTTDNVKAQLEATKYLFQALMLGIIFTETMGDPRDCEYKFIQTLDDQNVPIGRYEVVVKRLQNNENEKYSFTLNKQKSHIIDVKEKKITSLQELSRTRTYADNTTATKIFDLKQYNEKQLYLLTIILDEFVFRYVLRFSVVVPTKGFF